METLIMLLNILVLTGGAFLTVWLVHYFYKSLQLKRLAYKKKERLERRIQSRMKYGFSREAAIRSIIDFDNKLK